MKSRFFTVFRSVVLALSCVSFLIARPGHAAVGVTISPPIITNDFVGKISLTITGLTVGKTVRVEAFGDLNRSGINDAGEPLAVSFPVTDGQVPLIGGVRNLNVPGDDDGATNGQIRAELFLPWVDAGGLRTATKSLFRVSDPLGGFTSVTQSFTVVQRVYPQGVTGRVTAAGTGLPLTNTIVLLSLTTGPATTVAVTDTNGSYTFYSLPGTYVVGALKDGFVVNQTLAVSVVCNQFVTNNLALAAGNFTIAGKVLDTASGAGLPGLFVQAQSSDGLLFVGGLTDTNGNYALGVSANTWRIRPDKNGPAQIGYAALGSRTNVTVGSASVSNVNLRLPKATALIYGTVRDQNFNPVAGAEISAFDGGGQFDTRGRSTTNGSYCVGVTPGTWTIGPTPEELALRAYSVQVTNVTLADGQALNVNFKVIRTSLPALTKEVRLSNSQYQFLLNGLAGLNYTILSVTNLTSTNVQVVLVTNAACDSVNVLDIQATNSQRYYRAIIAP